MSDDARTAERVDVDRDPWACIDSRLRALEDEREVLRTLYRYGHALDYGPKQDFLDCFTADAVWRSAKTGEHGLPARRWEGREALGALWDAHTHAPDLLHKHLLIEPRLSIDGDRCTSVSYYLRVDEHADGPFIKAFGRYRDVFVSCTDGRWRLLDRLNESECYTPRGAAPVIDR